MMGDVPVHLVAGREHEIVASRSVRRLYRRQPQHKKHFSRTSHTLSLTAHSHRTWHRAVWREGAELPAPQLTAGAARGGLRRAAAVVGAPATFIMIFQVYRMTVHFVHFYPNPFIATFLSQHFAG